MRGNKPRYWEDVSEGDSLGYIVVGPWNINSFFAWVSAAVLKVSGSHSAATAVFTTPELTHGQP